ncbi:MAG: hypothetical protein JJE25_01960 [Bacteroidia bacterium]|nr:hypothetical protein [Bacteroidia bacterium]
MKNIFFRIMIPFALNKKAGITLLFFFIFTCQFSIFNSLHGQSIKEFTPNSVKYAEELKKFFEETASKQSAEILDDFIPLWKAGKFSSSEQDAIYRTSNQMMKRRMKAEPDFKNYLSALVAFALGNFQESTFTGWQQSLDALLQGKNTVFISYVLVSKSLFTDNSLYASQSVNWHADNNNFTFSFDSVAKISFPALTLTCTSKGDSSVIYNTKGVYSPTLESFSGSGGKVNWKRAGWDEKQIYATLKDYTIDVKRSEFTADTVTFHNPHFFKQPLTGRYFDKILASVTPEEATYPRFQSYDVSLEIKNIFNEIDYRG